MLFFITIYVYKHIKYDFKNGRIKAIPQEESRPTLFLRGYKVRVNRYDSSYGSTLGVPMEVESRELYLYFKAQIYGVEK